MKKSLGKTNNVYILGYWLQIESLWSEQIHTVFGIAACLNDRHSGLLTILHQSEIILIYKSFNPKEGGDG